MTGRLLAEFVLRSAVLLAAAEALRRMLRRKSPTTRHQVLVWAFILLALFPLLLLVLPEVQIPMLPVHSSSGQVTTYQNSFALADAQRTSPVWQAWGWFALWAVGVAAAVTPVAVGWIIAQRIERNSESLTDAEWLAMLAELAEKQGIKRLPELLIAKNLPSPVTSGVRRPRILLPLTAREWTPLRRRAVLLHELAHIARGDLAIQFGVHLLSALWWFQPLVWIARRSVRTESEMACDAAALRCGLRPSQYAGELLAIARSAGGRPRFSGFAAISMAYESHLETRLRSILHPVAGLPQRRLKWATPIVLTITALCASTFTAQGTQSFEHKGEFMIKGSLLSGLLISAGLSAGTVSGSILNPNGAAIPDAHLLSINPNHAQNSETSSDANGHFAVNDATSGGYILQVEKPGFSSLLTELGVKDDTKIERAFTMGAGAIEQSTRVNAKSMPAKATQAAPPTRVRVGGRVEQANIIYKVQPVYPKSAKDAGLQGTVEIEAEISKEGVPQELHIVSSPGADLSQSALTAVQQWRYRPVLLNGQPVDVVTTVIVNYTLSK